MTWSATSPPFATLPGMERGPESQFQAMCRKPGTELIGAGSSPVAEVIAIVELRMPSAGKQIWLQKNSEPGVGRVLM